MIIILSIISACLYRIGGASRNEIKFANSQYRDIGCPIVVFTYLCLTFGFSWMALLSSLLILGFIRTYHDYTGKDNMYLHGLFIGLSLLPMAYVGINLYKIVAYTSILTVSMGVLNTICTRIRVPFSVWIEELFRGFIIIFGLLVI